MYFAAGKGALPMPLLYYLAQIITPMGMVCELRQLGPDYAKKLLADPDEVFHYVDKADAGRLPKEAQGEDLNLDKAWHGLHYLLTGTAWAGPEPSCYLLAGGAQVGDEEEHDVYGYGPARILNSAQVADFSAAVNALTPNEIDRRYNPAEMKQLDIYPIIWDRLEETANNLDFLTASAAELRVFLRRAVAQQQAIIIYLA
jgi:hypothetical protein